MLGVQSGDAKDVTSSNNSNDKETTVDDDSNKKLDEAKEEKDEESPPDAEPQPQPKEEKEDVVAEDVLATTTATASTNATTNNNNAYESGIEVALEQGIATAAATPVPIMKKNPLVELHETQIRPALQKAGQSVRGLGQGVQTKSRELSFGTQMAVAAATAQTAHTLQQIGANPLEHDDGDGDASNASNAKVRVKGQDSDGWITGFHAYGVQGMSVIGFLSAVVSMVLVVGHLVDISSLLTLVLSPLVFWQKIKLKELGGMRGQQNELRRHVNDLTSENTRLSSSIDDMEQQVAKLQYVEQELDGIAKTAGGQVDRLVQIVHQNGEIQKEIKAILDDEILQQIITAVINTDRDSDYRLNKREVRQLEYRLKNIPGVTFHHERFAEFIASDEGDLTLADVTHIARNLQDPNVPEDKKIFQYLPKQIMQAKKEQEEAAAGNGTVTV